MDSQFSDTTTQANTEAENESFLPSLPMLEKYEDPERRDELKQQVKGGLVVAGTVLVVIGIKSLFGK